MNCFPFTDRYPQEDPSAGSTRAKRTLDDLRELRAEEVDVIV